MIETGKILQKRYRIDEQIGQGGMGAVYVATDERFGSTVAIKETLCMDDNYRRALEREARLLNSLKHVALPGVSDHFLEEDGQFLVMEYIAGEDLHDIQEKQGKPFPIEHVLDWADQLLDALEFLHNQANPVIHRDIKPQNLKVTPRGQIVLLDFGLAKGNVTGAGYQTAAKSIFGYSRNYASLEQIQGTGTDPRSDLYSLAATLYHLATNAPPEDALTRAMAVLSHQPDPLVPANVLEPSIPRGVAAILQIAMDLNAGARPSSASEMREMLRNHERYLDLETSSFAPAAIGFLDQKTKLMPGTTRQAPDRQTHIKTEILHEDTSEETSVRKAAFPTSANRSRGRRFAFVVAAALAALCVFAGGVYFSDTFAPGQTMPDTVAPVTSGPWVEKHSEQPPGQVGAASTEQSSAGVLADNPPAKSQSQVKSAKSTANSGKRGTSEPGTAIVGPNDVYAGNVRIHNGVVETPDTFIDENGVRRKIPGVVLPQPPMLPPNSQYLTPEQREKLKMLNRRHFRIVVPSPTPK